MNAIAAVTYFHNHGLARIVEMLRDRYVTLGKVGGQIVVKDSTLTERKEIASFLRKPLPATTSLVVRLSDVDRALQSSGFACTLPELLVASSNEPLITRSQQQQARQERHEQFQAALSMLTQAQPSTSPAHRWLATGAHGANRAFARFKNAGDTEQQEQLAVLETIARALNTAPWSGTPERLALFAQRITGDPHALDRDREVGRLFLLSLADLDEREAPHDRSEEIYLYQTAGIVVDMISSSVAVCRLIGAILHDGLPDLWIQTAGNRIVLLPLCQIVNWRNIMPADNAIYVVENPSVFETIAGVCDHTLICTSGWPGSAALLLLDLLLAQSSANQIYYNGDFDLAGLQIAAHLLARYHGRCHLWHLDAESYTAALHERTMPANPRDLTKLANLPEVFADLAAAMRQCKQWAYQEGIAHLLSADFGVEGME